MAAILNGVDSTSKSNVARNVLKSVEWFVGYFATNKNAHTYTDVKTNIAFGGEQ